LSGAYISSFRRRKKIVGNYSNNPQAALEDAVQKGYTNIRFQQGKPILDRELNLAADLAAPQRLFQKYLGNGTPEGSDGFRVDTVDLAAGDFQIKAGRFLVNGYEAVLDADTTYKNQPHDEHVAPLSQTDASFIFLRVFTVEVNDTEDADLHNSGDIGFETTLRERVEWEVLVTTDPNLEGRDLCLLATVSILSVSDLATSSSSADQAQVPPAGESDSISVTPPAPRDSVFFILKDERVRGLSLAKVRADLDRLMNPERTELADAIVSTSKLQSLAVTSDKLGNASVGFVKLATQPLFNLITTIFPGGTIFVLVATRDQIASPNFYILVNVQTSRFTNFFSEVSWTEGLINGDRYVIITNTSAFEFATVSVQSLKLLNVGF
jgi:hypothetical protein